MRIKNKFFLLLLSLVPAASSAQSVLKTDICVYGATSGGVIAACSAARAGKKVLLIEPGQMPGGLSSGGLGMTDIGNKSAITGIARDFYKRVGRVYGKPEQWIFEPHVAETIFRNYLSEAAVPVRYGYRLQRAAKNENRISAITIDSNGATIVVEAKEFIDCSY